MKTEKIKRYRLGVSRTFPTTHPKKGKPTFFVEKIQLSLDLLIEAPGDFVIDLDPKLHTCRANYPLWEKRMKEVQAGRAVIELFYWEGKPYRSKQVVFAVLDKDSGCGVQELRFEVSNMYFPAVMVEEHGIDKYKRIIGGVEKLAKNDGLLFDDFEAWFKGYNLSEPMAIIQFTKFRY